MRYPALNENSGSASNEMGQNQQNILIIDDHALFADGLRFILKTLGPHIKICVSNTAMHALSDISALNDQNLVLIDLHMPNMDGFSFLSAVRAQKLPLTVAVISGTEDKAQIERSIALGAQGFIPKNSPSEEMLKAVSTLLSGGSYLPRQWIGDIDFITNTETSYHSASITKRQLQVLQLMQEGLQNKQISAVLGISVSSVKGHIEKTFKLMGVNNRTACVQAARDRGLV